MKFLLKIFWGAMDLGKITYLLLILDLLCKTSKKNGWYVRTRVAKHVRAYKENFDTLAGSGETQAQSQLEN